MWLTDPRLQYGYCCWPMTPGAPRHPSVYPSSLLFLLPVLNPFSSALSLLPFLPHSHFLCLLLLLFRSLILFYLSSSSIHFLSLSRQPPLWSTAITRYDSNPHFHTDLLVSTSYYPSLRNEPVCPSQCHQPVYLPHSTPGLCCQSPDAYVIHLIYYTASSQVLFSSFDIDQ